MRSTSRSSSRSRRDGSRCCQAEKRERLTPSTRHIVLIECSAFFAATNRKITAGSRCPWRRRPRLSEDLALLDEDPVLTAQAPQVLALNRGQPLGLASSTSTRRDQLRSDCGEHPSSRESCAI